MTTNLIIPPQHLTLRTIRACDKEYDRVVDLEKQCFNDRAMSRRELKTLVALDNVSLPVVVFYDDLIIAYLINSPRPGRHKLLRLGVDISFRRRRVGSYLLDQLKSTLTFVIETIDIYVPSAYLDAQLFLKSAGFVAQTPIHRNYYIYDDAYKMVYTPENIIHG